MFGDDKDFDFSVVTDNGYSIDDYEADLAKAAQGEGQAEGDEGDNSAAPPDSDDQEEGEEGAEPTEDEEEAAESEDDEEEGAEPTEDEDDDQQSGKRVQTPEERAYYAELRRQREAEQKIQQQLEMMRQTMPEVQLAQMLQRMYGKTPQEVLQALQEAHIQQQAQERGVTPEYIREEQRLLQERQMVEQQRALVQMESFINRMEYEGRQLRQKYPQLTPNDLTDAVIYMMQMNTPHMPLEQAVRAIYADKLYQADLRSVKQEVMAELSGRKKGPIPPKGGKSKASAPALTDVERVFAEKLGIPEEEWVKHR